MQTPFRLPAASARPALQRWLAGQPYAAYLDGCNTPHDGFGAYLLLAGAALGPEPRRMTEPQILLDRLSLDHKQISGNQYNKWLFGALSYEWGYDAPAHAGLLPAPHAPPVACLPVQFFEADVVVMAPRALNVDDPDYISLIIESEDETIAQKVISELIYLAQQPSREAAPLPKLRFESNFTAEAYRQAVAHIRELVRQGDCYQVNLTQAFTAHDVPPFDVFAAYSKLVGLAPMPQSGVLRWGSRALVCASPERFLRYEAASRRLVSQPIKGTAPRAADPAADAALQAELLASEKQRAENVMIVDLVRNDLNRTAAVGSVRVPHLFEVQSFRHYHHLVSSIVSQLSNQRTPADALLAAFPPGSMTGAPKLRAMQRIHELEPCGRGLYSGSLGYIAPDGSFDFNVVIRSLVYDDATATASYHVGGAVTYDSDPQAEYDESLLKAAALRRLFGAE